MRWDRAGLIEALHGGLFEQPLWQGFLDRLRDFIGAADVGLRLRAGEHGTLLQLGACHLPDFLPYQLMRPGRVYALDELIDGPGGQPPATAQPDLRIVRVSDPSGVDAWLGCAGDAALPPSVSALLSALVPHLAIALRTYVALEQERQRSAVAAETFGRLNFGWITLDAGCRIVDQTPHAENFFRESALLRRGRYDRLVPASPRIDRELSALVKAIGGGEERQPRAFNLSRDPLTDILVAPLRDRAISAGQTAVAIVYLSGDRWSRRDRHEQLAGLFGLLPSEARMAWAMTQGLSIADAAASLGLTRETGRHYSKTIYAKTGAKGHADLVRIVLTSALAIA